MSKIYDIAFRMGVLFNIVLWTILNIVSLINLRSKIAELENRGMTGWIDLRWGFPFPMFDYDSGFIDGIVLIGNAIVYVLGAFFFGFLFKIVWSKISRHHAEFSGTPSS